MSTITIPDVSAAVAPLFWWWLPLPKNEIGQYLMTEISSDRNQAQWRIFDGLDAEITDFLSVFLETSGPRLWILSRKQPTPSPEWRHSPEVIMLPDPPIPIFQFPRVHYGP